MAGAAWWDSHFLSLDYGFGKSSAFGSSSCPQLGADTLVSDVLREEF
ncbi:MAG: hypothetical protein ACHP9V_05955 [Terriglobales bacterium]